MHDAEYLATLSTDRNFLVCLSERSFYLLLNLAASDAGFLARYAVEKLDDGYLPVTRDHLLYPVVSDAIEALGVELVDMSCDIVAVLEEIRDVLRATSAQAQCCYDLSETPYYDDEPGVGSPEELCLLAYAYALYWEAGSNELYHQFALGAFPSLGVVTAIFDAFDLPAQAVLQMVTWGATNALPVIESVWRLATQALVVPITCAVYNASGSAEAIAAIAAAMEDQGVEGIALDLMRAPITASGLNKVYAGTFPIEGVEPIDCEDFCGQVNCGGPLFELGCAPGGEGECGSGDQTPGLVRVWTASLSGDEQYYAIYSRLDTNRLVTITSAPGWTPKEGQPECRWFGCYGELPLTLLGETDDPMDMPADTCLNELVVIGMNPFILVVNIGDECVPELP